MSVSGSNLYFNIGITAAVLLFVLLMPLVDRLVCKKLKINVEHSLVGNSRENRLLRLRMAVLYFVLAVYLAANVWLVFFSRSAAEEYLVHVDPLGDLINSVRIDSGILGTITEIYSLGLSEGLSNIHVEKPEDIAQVYMNVMLYVPLGYLLPYVFEFCRKRMRIRPVLCCFVASFITENLQLVFRRGFYDIDDLLSNTLGGLIGQTLYITFAYVTANPDWRKELSSFRRWKRRARKRTLYPFARRIGTSRTTLIARDENVVKDFYVRQLGFRPIKKLTYGDDPEVDYLMQIGSFQLEVICTGTDFTLRDQYLTMSVSNIPRVKKRLEKNGFETGDYETDPYTGLRMLTIEGPEHVHISFLEN